VIGKGEGGRRFEDDEVEGRRILPNQDSTLARDFHDPQFGRYTLEYGRDERRCSFILYV
jgi:hypothetical protein